MRLVALNEAFDCAIGGSEKNSADGMQLPKLSVKLGKRAATPSRVD
jgi:hypothetical protein